MLLGWVETFFHERHEFLCYNIIILRYSTRRLSEEIDD